MESKKNIGKLFRDNLDQMDFSPSEKVWDRIEIDLEKKKKKRRFLFWLFFTIITTSMLTSGAVVYFSNNQTKTDTSIENTVSNTTNSRDKSNQNKSNSSSKQSAIKSYSNTVLENNDSKLNSKISTKKTNTKKTNTTKTNKLISKKGNMTSNTSYQSSFSKLNSSNKVSKPFKYAKNSNSRKNKNNATSSKGIKNPTEFEKTNDPITTTNNVELNLSNPLANNTTSNPKVTDDLAPKKEQDSLKKNTVRKQNKKEINPKPEDSTAEKPQDEFKKVVVVAPYIGLNYIGFIGNYDALTKGNIINKKGSFAESYGVLVRYMISETTGFQLGIGKLNSKYDVTIDRSSTAFINEESISSELPTQFYNNLFSNSAEIKLTKETSYYEVPIEGYYVLLNKKFGIASSLGVSLFYLGKNEVYAESEQIEKTKIGSFSTLLQTSATANAKLYLYYQIMPKLSFDVYPTFQYQLFGNSDSSNYSTYFFSVRAGIGYRF